jgi:NAD(P)-dependent dehydrogenase (short-subunit alcohol dehydrogenase family)
MPTLLITGANRGVGYQLTTHYAAEGWSVIATCRNPDEASELTSLGGDVEVMALDVNTTDSVLALKAQLGDRRIDRLLNNAGVYGPRTGFGETDYDAWLEVFNTNAVGPMRMIETFSDNVVASDMKQIFNISSVMSSMDATVVGSGVIYRSSKAALNMVCRSSAAALGEKGVTVANFHPGWVQTDMGGPQATLTPEESRDLLVNTFASVNPSNNGLLYAPDGAPIPW